MDAISYERAPDAAAAIRSASQPGVVFIGGGTNLLDLMKGEYQAAEKLGMAADVIAVHPSALQLRYLQTLVEISAEKASTTIFPLPIDLLRPFLERGHPQAELPRPPALATGAPSTQIPQQPPRVPVPARGPSGDQDA